jgi:hypothetical protein
MVRDKIEKSLMSTAHDMIAPDQSERHEPVRMGTSGRLYSPITIPRLAQDASDNADIPSLLVQLPVLEQVDSPAIAAGFVFAGPGQDEDRTSLLSSDTLVEQ